MKPKIPHPVFYIPQFRLILKPFLMVFITLILSFYLAIRHHSNLKNDPTFEWHLLYLKIRDSLVSKKRLKSN